MGQVRTRSAIEEDKKNEMLERIDKLRYLIQLQLNRKEKTDQEIIELINIVPDLTDPAKRVELDAAIKKLIEKSQDLLKKEWEKAKDESVKGRLT